MRWVALLLAVGFSVGAAFTVHSQDIQRGGATAAPRPLCMAAVPTISSGFGTTPSIAANNGTCAFTVNVGAGAVATSGVIGLPTAVNGWSCDLNDINAAVGHQAYNTRQTVTTATTVTVENQTTSTGAAIAWGANDILVINCLAY